MSTRLSTLDSSFLEVESPSAHMHVGWAALFRPPPQAGRPTFGEVRSHIAGRMGRAPRYRQRLARIDGIGDVAHRPNLPAVGVEGDIEAAQFQEGLLLLHVVSHSIPRSLGSKASRIDSPRTRST